jgi:hypothetical protein
MELTVRQVPMDDPKEGFFNGKSASPLVSEINHSNYQPDVLIPLT